MSIDGNFDYEDAQAMLGVARDAEMSGRQDVADTLRAQVLEKHRMDWCPGCESMVDPDWCHCGDEIRHDGRGHWSDPPHAPVPIGCVCHLRHDSKEPGDG